MLAGSALARTATSSSPKVSRPRLPGVVARERLFARLEIWYHVDPGDADPASFFHCLRATFDCFAAAILTRATSEDQRALMLGAMLPRITAQEMRECAQRAAVLLDLGGVAEEAIAMYL